ncbi:MAG: methylated-DNA--[protein]-cysteine S-methyltransferase [Akkermansia sp.]
MLRTDCLTFARRRLWLLTDATSILGLWFEGQRFFGRPYGQLPAPASRPEGLAAEVLHWLQRYSRGSRPSAAELPLRPVGSPFCCRVWRALQQLPYGSTLSYGQLAARVGSSPRAVGAAVARNPILLLIPCHRLICSNGTLGGYAAGQDIKELLLRHEGALPPKPARGV